ncbi:hypothetical protein Ddc_16015 [Ditylenchus destructor]|nr:hypothetical protein Ddc_16015 [Ditylenchus destructor]
MSLSQMLTVTSVFLLTAFIAQVYPVNWNIAEKTCLDKIEKSKWGCHRTVDKMPEIANKTALDCYRNLPFLQCVDSLLAENCDRDTQNAIWSKSPFPMPEFNISDIKQFPECDKLIQWFDGKSGFLSSENSTQSSTP